MATEVLVLIEVYECKHGSTTDKKLIDEITLKYCSEKFPNPKDFAEYLESLGQEVAEQNGIKGRASVEIPNGSPRMHQLRKMGIIIDRVFIMNLFIE